MPKRIKQGDRRKLNRTINIIPSRYNGEPVRFCEPPYYLFPAGTEVIVRADAPQVGKGGYIYESEKLIMVHTDEVFPRLVAAYITELDAM